MQSFNEKCYELLRKVPAGRVTCYKSIALALNCRAYQAIGNAMNKNPYFGEVPCHRVVKANGELGGFAYGEKLKKNMLEKEGVFLKDGKIINFKRVLFEF